jgi:cell division transport system permease protein
MTETPAPTPVPGNPVNTPVPQPGAGAARTGPAIRSAVAIVPSQSIAGRALSLVIAIMTFLACMTFGTVIMVVDSARDWQSDVSREVTIQIRPVDGVDIDTEVKKAIAVAGKQPGIGSVEAISEETASKLLEPWLGSGFSLRDLPVPRLVRVQVDDADIFDVTRLRRLLTNQVTGADVDDHTAWTQRLSTMANAIVIAGITVLVLVLSAMVFSIVFATRAAMAGNSAVVEVLHFVGAEDAFVAGEFQRHFLNLGLRGGAIGGGAAAIVFVVLALAAGNLATTSIDTLFGGLRMGSAGYVGIVGVVFFVAALTAGTSRISVHRYLSALN